RSDRTIFVIGDAIRLPTAARESLAASGSGRIAYRRIATEESWINPELLALYQKMLKESMSFGFPIELEDRACVRRLRPCRGHSLALWMASMTAAVTSAVLALPPRSGVSAVTRSIARINRSPAGFSRRCSSIMTVPIGVAIPLPIMSKAEPWIGSNIEGKVRSGLGLAGGAQP